MNGMILLAAYGRSYKTQEEMLKDWEDGKDFKIYGGPYCSKEDATVGDVIEFMYDEGDFALEVVVRDGFIRFEVKQDVATLRKIAGISIHEIES
jgi:hypothetical protein